MEAIEKVNSERNSTGERKRSFAIVLRGDPTDFAWLLDQCRAAGLYVVYSKSSQHKLEVREAPF